MQVWIRQSVQAVQLLLPALQGGGATSATWSGGTGTYAPNNTTLNAVYTPSAAESNSRNCNTDIDNQ